MNFTFHHLGALDQGELALNDLTIICGENNIGKTYLTYALYGFLSTGHHYLEIKISEYHFNMLKENGLVEIDLKKEYLNQIEGLISEAIKSYKEDLSNVLAAQSDRFKNTELECRVSIPDSIFSAAYEQSFESEKGRKIISFLKTESSSILKISAIVPDTNKLETLPKRLVDDTVKDIIWGNIFPNPFIVSTERTGAITFRNDLNLARNKLIDIAHKMKNNSDFSPMDVIKSFYDTGYPMPVSDNLEFINTLHKIEGRKSFLVDDHSEILAELEGIAGGKYKTSKEGDVNFVLGKSKQKLKMGESSSSVRSLVIQNYYLRHFARKGDILIIDEPELNLHPSNQRRMARLLARLVNLGIKVFITTHSDYIVKEFNSLIMLGNKKEGIAKIREELGYHEQELLAPEKVSLYMVTESELYLPKGNKKRIRGTVLKKADIDPILGIDAPTFDTTINQMNSMQDKIYNILSE